jgi:hypothetical protein
MRLGAGFWVRGEERLMIRVRFDILRRKNKNI